MKHLNDNVSTENVKDYVLGLMGYKSYVEFNDPTMKRCFKCKSCYFNEPKHLCVRNAFSINVGNGLGGCLHYSEYKPK